MKGNKDIIKNIEENKNYILAEINIKKNNINKNIRILNSFEENRRIYKWHHKKDDYKYENEKEIKENCIIKINNKVIPFNYLYNFKEKGKFKIEYSFKNNIKSLANLFSECKSLKNIDLSNFNTQNITDMSYMFYKCYSLTNIDLSNFNTQNVTNMSYMFYECNSLINIDLSNFNTQNVTNMSYMFYECNTLINIDLSNFNTQNVKYMFYMFERCNSLTNIDLSNFNTQNVVSNMSYMFYECNSLIKLNLIY